MFDCLSSPPPAPRILSGLASLLLVAASASTHAKEPSAEPSAKGSAEQDRLLALGYEPLFNGVDLSGWRNPYPHGTATVVDGEIHLRSNKKFFLVTDRKFDDFRLVAEIKLPPGPANSGIMFRCHVEPGRVYGYQAECDGSDRRWSAGLFDEGRRKWIWPSVVGRSAPEFVAFAAESQAAFERPRVRDALRRDGWNQFVIDCREDRITISLNDVKVTELRDPVDSIGHIGIQHHGEDDQVYRFRNLFIKQWPEIPAEHAVGLTSQAPVAVESVAPDVILLDFGKVAFGNVRLKAPTRTAKELTVRFGERLADGRIDRHPPGSVRFSEQVVRLSDSTEVRVEPPLTRRNVQQTAISSPAVLTPAEWGAVGPFRWVEIEGPESALSTVEVARDAAFAKDWDDRAALFECSDPLVNEIWDLCKYSIKATTFAGVYVDGDRERIPYEADAYLNQLSHYYAEGDVHMARRTFDWLMEHPTWPTEWAPHMIFMAHADWRYTGDVAWLEPRYEALRSKTLSARVDATGLVQSSLQQRERDDIVDWPKSERDGFVFTKTNSVVNAFHIAALVKMSELADALGKADEAQGLAARAHTATIAYNAAFLGSETGLYRDGVGVDHSSLHANLFPLAFGLVPQDRRHQISHWLTGRGMQCSVYAAQYLLEGLFESGAGVEAVGLMTADGPRSWKHMLEQDATITWEAWDAEYKPNLDWNHAWGAAPANLLPRYILGVEPKTAGWKEVSISPNPSGLAFARGIVPTARGPISVDWENDLDFRLNVELPEGALATVTLPSPSEGQRVFVNDVPASAHLRQGRWELEEPLSGKVSIVLR